MDKTMHIGLIGGIGPAATVLYYENIVARMAANNASLQLTIAHTSVAELAANAAAQRKQQQAQEYLRVANQLAAAGAEAIAITSMGGHFCVQEFAAIAPRPLINGPDAVARHVLGKQISRIGLLGTRTVMQTKLYAALADIEVVTPTGDALQQADRDYVAIAMAGAATPEQADRLLAAGEALVREQGAQAVLLGGTDLDIVFGQVEVDYPVIDSALAHVEHIVEVAMRGQL